MSYVALGLQQLGFRAGDVLAAFDVRRAHLLFTVLAAQTLGGSVLPLEPRISRYELRELLGSRSARFGFAGSAEHLDRLLALETPALDRIVFDDRALLGAYVTDVIASYEAVRETGARHGRLAFGRFAVLAGRVPPSATAFEFVESAGTAEARGPVSHADLLGAVQRLDPRTERRACPELAISPRLSSTYNSALATVGWLEYGFTVLTLEDEAVGVDHLPENDRSFACRSSNSRRGARSAAAR